MISISAIANVLMVLLAISTALAVIQFIAYFKSLPKTKKPSVEKLPELKEAKSLRTTTT